MPSRVVFSRFQTLCFKFNDFFLIILTFSAEKNQSPKKNQSIDYFDLFGKNTVLSHWKRRAVGKYRSPRNWPVKILNLRKFLLEKKDPTAGTSVVNPASRGKRFFTGTNSQKVIKIIDFLLIISSGLKTGIDFLDILIDFFD